MENDAVRFRISFSLCYWIVEQAKIFPWWKRVMLAYRASRLPSFQAQEKFLLQAAKKEANHAKG